MICPPFLFFTLHNSGNKKTVIAGLYQSAICYGFLIFRAKKPFMRILTLKFFSNGLFSFTSFPDFLG